MFKFYKGPSSGPLFLWAGIIQKKTSKIFFANNKINQNDINHLTDFCFPSKDPISGPISFVFRFKPNNSNEFLNFFCLLDQTSFQLTDLDTNEQCCICIASLFYHFDVFDESLKIIRSLLLRSFNSAQSYIKTFHDKPNSIISNCPCLQNLIKSNNNSFIPKIIQPIEILDSTLIGHIIMALLTDTSVIILSSNIGHLSQFCYSLSAALYPLIWHHLFIPIVPPSCLESLESPAPFLAGILRSLENELPKDRIEGHIKVDLDQNKLFVSKVTPLPSWALSITETLDIHKKNGFSEFIIKVLCQTLEIEAASSPITTARRISAAIKSIKESKKPTNCLTYQEAIISSRTLQPLFEIINTRPIPKEFLQMIESGNHSEITSPAAQNLSEFPLKNQHVMRSMSFQLGKQPSKNGIKISSSLPLIGENSLLLSQN